MGGWESDSHVEDCGAFVALRDRVVDIVWKLGATDNMAPVDAYSVASLDVDNFARNGRLESGVAGNVTIVYVLNRVVRGGRTNSNELPVVVPVDPVQVEFCRSRRGETLFLT
jgi:hypothetical protein